MAEYLMKYNFHLMEDTIQNRVIIYEDGLNYKDDGLLNISNKSNTGFFNYLFFKGDVILFYAHKTFPKTKIKASELPPNVRVYNKADSAQFR